jgi:thioredoxin reductase
MAPEFVASPILVFVDDSPAFSDAIFGARVEVSRNVSRLARVDGLHRLCLAGGRMVTSRTVVIATRARYRKLQISDYERFELRNITVAVLALQTGWSAALARQQWGYKR